MLRQGDARNRNGVRRNDTIPDKPGTVRTGASSVFAKILEIRGIKGGPGPGAVYSWRDQPTKTDTVAVKASPPKCCV